MSCLLAESEREKNQLKWVIAFLGVLDQFIKEVITARIIPFIYYTQSINQSQHAHNLKPKKVFETLNSSVAGYNMIYGLLDVIKSNWCFKSVILYCIIG